MKKEYECSVCGQIYEHNWFSVKRVDNKKDSFYYIQCPKDGGIAYRKEVVDLGTIAKVGKAKVDKAKVGNTQT